MKRDLENKVLIPWRGKKDRRPLLLRGARQVGKTYLVRDFAQAQFEQLVEINFELRPDLIPLFDELDPAVLIKNLNIVLNVQMTPGKTLLFLDEIQACPRALMALRYFYEKFPELHVIGAGSLLDFCLEDKEFRMPVGRVQYAYLQPLSFQEFLSVTGQQQLREALGDLSLQHPFPETIHRTLLKQLRQYLLIGGMPAVVQQSVTDPVSMEYKNLQTLILQTYRDDFGKYASRTRQFYLSRVFATAHQMVGKRYKYAHVDPESQSRDLKEALLLLERAGVIYRVLAASVQGGALPVNDKKFKIVFLDVGLMQHSLGLEAQITMAPDFTSLSSGALAEQLVGQELLAQSDPYEDRKLFFWTREKKNSQAEIDYLARVDNQVIPIEVKAGQTGTLKSLRLFMESHKTPLGVRLATHPLSFHDQILSVPLYAVEEFPRLCRNLP